MTFDILRGKINPLDDGLVDKMSKSQNKANPLLTDLQAIFIDSQASFGVIG